MCEKEGSEATRQPWPDSEVCVCFTFQAPARPGCCRISRSKACVSAQGSCEPGESGGEGVSVPGLGRCRAVRENKQACVTKCPTEAEVNSVGRGPGVGRRRDQSRMREGESQGPALCSSRKLFLHITRSRGLHLLSSPVSEVRLPRANRCPHRGAAKGEPGRWASLLP